MVVGPAAVVVGWFEVKVKNLPAKTQPEQNLSSLALSCSRRRRQDPPTGRNIFNLQEQCLEEPFWHRLLENGLAETLRNFAPAKPAS